MIKTIINNSDNRIVNSTDINLLFQNWRGKDEKIVAVGPHDDDVLIGAGLLLCELRNLGIDIYVAIITDGRKGYCKEEQKHEIESIRKKETELAYTSIGINLDNIKRFASYITFENPIEDQIETFDFPDSDLYQHAFKWETEEDENNGLVALLLEYFREKKATRFLLPNENDFHLDHQATFKAGLYAVIQSSEKIIPDLGKPCSKDTILRYGVWSPFKGNPTHSIQTSQDTLERKLNGIFAYKSQEQIEEITKRIRCGGPLEFFQEYKVKPFPIGEYTELFFGNKLVVI